MNKAAIRRRFDAVVRRVLRRFGYLKCDYGFSCGRHWVEIDGKVIAQTSGDDVWLRDEDVHRLGYAIIDHGKHWSAPNAEVTVDE
jgi:hypothetical protein